MKPIARIIFAFTLCATSTVARADVASEDAWLRTVNDSEAASFNGPGALENNALATAKGHAERLGDSLTLYLTNDKKLVLKDDKSCPEKRKTFEANCYSYRLIADLPSRHFFLIEKNFYEGSKILLINNENGSEAEISGLPWFDASGDRFLTIDNDEGYGDLGRLEIWKRSGDGLALEWKANDDANPVSHYGRFISWTDDTIRLEFSSLPMGGEQAKHWPATLMKTNAGWKLQTKWPKLSK